MNKKVILGIIIIVIIVISGIIYFTLTSKEEVKEIRMNNQQNTEKFISGNIAIIYFSATGNTKQAATYLEEETNGTLIEIIPEDEYTNEDLDYSNDNCRANKEQNDANARPAIKNNIDITDYDTIFLGYPIWWGDVPKIILTFLDNTNLENKTVIPFCTSGGSGIETSEQTLQNYNDKINWQKGRRLDTTKDSVTSWLEELNY